MIHGVRQHPIGSNVCDRSVGLLPKEKYVLCVTPRVERGPHVVKKRNQLRGRLLVSYTLNERSGCRGGSC